MADSACKYSPFNFCDPKDKTEKFKNKIVETTGSTDSEMFQSTHLINKYGQIYETDIKRSGSQRFESRYSFNKICYRYDLDFTIESDYYTGGMIDEHYEPFIRVYFEYEK